MTAHETPIPGTAADFAATLCARLPVLETRRTRLRAPRLSDFDAWAEIFCGSAGTDLGGPFTRDQAFVEFGASIGLWLLRGFGTWTVEDRAGKQVLGFVILGFEPGDLEPELGYLFRASSRGQGLATEAAGAARDHAMGVLNLPSLVSYVALGNDRSAALARRLGAHPDGESDDCAIWRHPLQGASA